MNFLPDFRLPILSYYTESEKAQLRFVRSQYRAQLAQDVEKDLEDIFALNSAHTYPIRVVEESDFREELWLNKLNASTGTAVASQLKTRAEVMIREVCAYQTKRRERLRGQRGHKNDVIMLVLEEWKEWLVRRFVSLPLSQEALETIKRRVRYLESLANPKVFPPGARSQSSTMLAVLISLRKQLKLVLQLFEEQLTSVSSRERLRAIEESSKSLLHHLIQYLAMALSDTPTPRNLVSIESLRCMHTDPRLRTLYCSGSGRYLHQLVNSQSMSSLFPLPSSTSHPPAHSASSAPTSQLLLQSPQTVLSSQRTHGTNSHGRGHSQGHSVNSGRPSAAELDRDAPHVVKISDGDVSVGLRSLPLDSPPPDVPFPAEYQDDSDDLGARSLPLSVPRSSAAAQRQRADSDSADDWTYVLPPPPSELPDEDPIPPVRSQRPSEGPSISLSAYLAQLDEMTMTGNVFDVADVHTASSPTSIQDSTPPLLQFEKPLPRINSSVLPAPVVSRLISPSPSPQPNMPQQSQQQRALIPRGFEENKIITAPNNVETQLTVAPSQTIVCVSNHFSPAPYSGLFTEFTSPSGGRTLESFVQLHSLTNGFASLSALCKQAQRLSGTGGDLMIYGMLGKQLDTIMAGMHALLAQVSTTITSINEAQDSLYESSVFSVQLSATWHANYHHVLAIRWALDDAIKACSDQISAFRCQILSLSARGPERVAEVQLEAAHFATVSSQVLQRVNAVLCVESK